MNIENESRNGACLNEDQISGYLEGTLTAVLKTACEDHLIACNACRENLAGFMRLLAPESPEESAEIDAAVAQWEQRNVRAFPPKRRSSKRIGYGAGGIAAAILVAVLLFWTDPASELLQDLRGDRIFPPRMSDQPHADLVTTRSARPDRNIASLAPEMTRRKANSYEWGCFYLLAKDYEQAVSHLEQATNDRNTSAEIHNDLGVAYFQRDKAGDAERALQQFNAALARDNKFLPAIFNLALLYEREGLIAQAQIQQERYLQLDPSSGWAAEVSADLLQKEPRK